jgi:manganese/iron transport system permease protein
LDDIYIAGLISLIVTVITLLKRKDLLAFAFDPIQAKAVGLPIKILHYGFLAMVSLTIVSTLHAVGIILSIGLLIAPGAISFLLTKKFEFMLLYAILITLFSGISGIYLSFFIDSAPAPSIIIILSFIFIITFIYKNYFKKIV